MKLIVLTIFCLVITETITGSSIAGEHNEPAAVNNSQKNPIDAKIDSIEPTKYPDTNSTETTTTTTTAHPPPDTTSTTVTPPTTKSTTTSSSTTASPPTSSTTPATPNITTAAPHPTVTPTDSPAHKADRKFDSFSFIAGIVMAAGLMAIGLVAFKFYEARRDRNYHTI